MMLFRTAAMRRLLALIALLSAPLLCAAADARPFKAKLVVTESVLFLFVGPCFALGTVQATGNATHLGQFTATSHDCINPQGTFDPSQPNSFSFVSKGIGATGLVFVAANGETLFAAYSGTLRAQPSGPHRVAGHFIITGGTGRFFGATGGGTLSGYEDISQIVSGRGEIEAVGTIVY